MPKFKYTISPLEHGLATEFPSPHIPGTWSPSMENVRIDQHSLKKRWGYDTADRSLGSTSTVYVIAVYQQSTGTRYTMYLTDTDLYRKDTGGGGTQTSVGSGYTIPTNERWTWAVVDDKFCFTNGDVNVQYWGGSGTATDLNAAVAIKARYCIEYANRLFIADYGTVRDPYMVGWSKEGDPTDWTDSTAGSLALLETEDFITGLGKSGGNLLIFKRDNVYIYSRSGEATSPISSTPDMQVRGIGCVAPYSIVEVLGTSAFLGRDDFYIFNGNYPENIGKDLVRYNFFDQVSETALENVWGFTNTVANEIVWMATTTSGLKGYAWNYVNKEWSVYSFYNTITAAGRGAV